MLVVCGIPLGVTKLQQKKIIKIAKSLVNWRLFFVKSSKPTIIYLQEHMTNKIKVSSNLPDFVSVKFWLFLQENIINYLILIPCYDHGAYYRSLDHQERSSLWSCPHLRWNPCNIFVFIFTESLKKVVFVFLWRF